MKQCGQYPNYVISRQNVKNKTVGCEIKDKILTLYVSNARQD